MDSYREVRSSWGDMGSRLAMPVNLTIGGARIHLIFTGSVPENMPRHATATNVADIFRQISP
jgi:hypothetical protein